MKRKLAAIMFSDMVGYSRIVDKDEVHGLKLLDLHNHILSSLINKSEGRIVKYIGDGIFSVFESSVEAIDCAVSIQNKLTERNNHEQVKNQFEVRIGIHMGDVIEKDEDLYGDGVNIASRIESVALPRGIVISEAVLNSAQVDKKYNIRKIGPVKLKNIKEPHKLFYIYKNKKDYDKESSKDLINQFYNTGVNIVKKKSWVGENIIPISVLYFNNMSGESNEYLCYGLTDDLIMDFSKIGKVRIPMVSEVKKLHQDNFQLSDLARELQVRFIISGSVFKFESVIRISYHLINVDTGETLLAEKWQDKENQINYFRVELLTKVLEKLKLDLPEHLENHLNKKSKLDSKAYEFYLRGKFLIDQLKNKEDIIISRDLFKKAYDLDNSLTEANVYYGMTFFRLGEYNKAKKILDSNIDNLENETNINKSMILNCMGIINQYGMAEYKKAIKFYNDALEIQSKNDDKYNKVKTLNNISHSYLCLGNYKKANDHLSAALTMYEDLEDNRGIGIARASLANLENEKGDNYKALINYQKALRQFKFEKNILFQGKCYSQLAGLHIELGKLDSAIEFADLSLKIGNEFNDKILLGNGYYYKGLIEQKNENWSQSISFFEKGEMILLEPLKVRAIEIRIDKILSLVELNKKNEAMDLLSAIIEEENKIVNEQVLYLAAAIHYSIFTDDEIAFISLDELVLECLSADYHEYDFRTLYFLHLNGTHNKSVNMKIIKKAGNCLNHRADKISDPDLRNQFIKNSNEHGYFKKLDKEVKKDQGEQGLFKFCPECGFVNKDQFSFCPECGISLKKSNKPQKQIPL